MVPSERDLSVGGVVAERFRLERHLGEGGMGTVWSATHAITNKRVALKFVKRAHESDSARKRLLREAKAACAVQHENVREIHDILELDDGSPVMVMEYLVGESLADKLAREGKLPVAELARILVQVVSAVGTAHALGIVHRDLKPENIFITRAGAVKVLDFGIAKLTPLEGGVDETKLTHSGALMGTPCYMAPEQVFGEKDLDHRADVWALGLIAYECLTGVLPTRADNVGQVMKLIVTRTIKPVGELELSLPDDLAAMIDRMLSRDRARRPESLWEVQQLLARYTDHRAPSFGAPTSRPSKRGETPPAVADIAEGGNGTLDPAPADPPAPATIVEGGGARAAREGAGDEARPTPGVAETRDARTPAALDPNRVGDGRTARDAAEPVRAPRRLAVVGAVVVASVAVWWAAARASARGDDPPTASAAVAPPSPSVGASATGQSRAAPAPDPSSAVAVRVRIEPATAKVEVDGEVAVAEDGQVTIRGAVGSRHRVQLVSGGRRASTDVVVTADGAFPERVALADRPAAPPSAAPRATGALSATAAAAPSAAATPFKASDKFE